MTTYANRIARKLAEGLAPARLALKDESHKHARHADRRAALADRSSTAGAGETHFHVEVVSAAFEGKSPLARQRMVYALVREELTERVHALSITARTPAEAGL